MAVLSRLLVQMHFHFFPEMKRGREEMARRRVSECDVGITEYVCAEIPGFSGVIKDRFNDFLVNEINEDGVVVHLFNTQAPDDELPTAQSSHSDGERDVKLLDALLAGFDSIATVQKELVREIVELSRSKNVKSRVLLPTTGLKKEDRREIHAFFKNSFGSKLATETTDDGIVISCASQNSRQRSSTSVKKRFTIFTLIKENRDTMDAVSYLASLLGVPNKLFGFAGTKDRRGVTTQRISADRVSPKKLAALNTRLLERNMAIGDFTLSDSPLKLGNLRGNEFTIVLKYVRLCLYNQLIWCRQVDCSREQVETLSKSMSERGFINYFGMQRFGTGDIATHDIGNCILKSQWKDAVELLLAPSEDELDDIKRARLEWSQNGATQSLLDKLHARNIAEKQVLRVLSKEPNNYLGALQAVPRNLRLMYVHAYQSYIWNMAVSQRLQTYGFTIQKGDLVLRRGQKFATADDRFNAVHVVETEEDMSQYSIFDIILPLPGHIIRLPSNSIGAYYSKLLEKDGLALQDFKHTQKDFSLTGDYRYILSKPEGFEARLISYSDRTVPLVQNDLMKLKGESLLPTVTEGTYSALVLRFQLGTSEYATMCLRELMKLETSSSFHKQQSNK